ncbi:MAG: hypothetical protein J0H15_00555 [Xanthomonadales bacterium]|nr:hypothetical protein [Xanthomonadales bacterium]
MKPIIALLFLASGISSAQAPTEFALNDGRVRFHAPATWTAIMEKRDGNPQAIAFQVPNAAAAGTDDAADVTVKTRQLGSPADFGAAVADEQERARAQAGYEADGTADAGQHRYFVQRGGTRYLVRDSFRLVGAIAVEVRCRRPLLAATPTGWSNDFDGGCDRLVASLQP